jgi:hypothetical protein
VADTRFDSWLRTYGPLYGEAATATLFEAQRRFNGELNRNCRSPETAGNLYQQAISRKVRHALGEYFTPGWLADFVLDSLSYKPGETLLDPSAGFGVFLHRALERGAAPETLAGYEVNPLTAAWAKAAGLPVEVRDTLCNPGTRRFQVIAGNPPWVNWRYLNSHYRARIAPLWKHYRLEPSGGLGARLGAGMDDLSILFTYLAADRLLEEGGRMGLLLSRTLFQSAGGGRCFRRFELPDGRYLQVIGLHEIPRESSFRGAMTLPAAAILEVSRTPTIYPVPYYRGDDRLYARPVGADRTSAWSITRADSNLDRLCGKSAYTARVGAHSGGASGVYWVDVIEDRGKTAVIRNRSHAGRVRWPEVTAEVEVDLLRRLVRGRDVSMWRAQPSGHLLLPHSADGKPVSEDAMRRHWPRTYAYFERFRERMLERAHYRQHFARQAKPHWSMYNVGAYTFAQHRVVWREQSRTFECAVLSDPDWIADAKLAVVACQSADEALYVAAMLNSTLSREFVESYAIRIQISTHVLAHLRVPKFDPADRRNVDLVSLALTSPQSQQLDALASQIYGLT